MQKLVVKATREYDVLIEKDYSLLLDALKKVTVGDKILIVTDTNVAPLYLKRVQEILCDYKVFTLTVTAGENSKNTRNYLDICGHLAENKFSRTDAVLALGGGVVGDLAGFACATYMRGICFIQCPTTLLSMVDSSVGGKTAVNLEQGKNLLGAFYQPSLVYVSLETLNTLPKSEIANGMGEIIKYAFLSTTVTPEMISTLDYQTLILTCLKIKADVVNKDEFEGGVRATLNLGHTVGHAIENLSGYKIPHGVCVAKGLNKILSASQRYYGLDVKKLSEFYALLNAYPFDLTVPFSDKEIINKIVNDKKADGDTVKAVLVEDIGKVNVVKMKIEQFGELIK